MVSIQGAECMRWSALVRTVGAIAPLLLAMPAVAGEGARQFAQTDKPVSLHIRICFLSPGRPVPFCREVPLTPGAAGGGFDSLAACEDAKARTLETWFRQAKDVFGFSSGWTGRDYLISDPRCVRV
jgi:hypothetical protein